MNGYPKHFYLTPLSTASQHIYPNNTHYDFIVELAETINLCSDVKWEVGLCEYACPPLKTVTYQSFKVSGNQGPNKL